MKESIGYRFQKMSRLYHFTSFNAACKIIRSGKLRFSKSYKLNDLIESNRIVFEHVLSEELLEGRNGLLAEAEMHKYQQISFSQDREYDGMHFLGFDLHTMWGLYADKGYGVCLVFDKDKLTLSPGDYANDIKYYPIIPQYADINNKSVNGIKAEVWRKKDDIFFCKRKEWEYEQEYRIIRRARLKNDIEFLDVSESLSFAIICKDQNISGFQSMFDSEYYWELRNLNKRVPVLTYENDLDGYTLFEKFMVPIWAEQCGYL